MKPIILIGATSGEDKNRHYIESIEAHGGTARLIHPGEDFKNTGASGLLLTGGGDLSEQYYEHALTETERKTLGTIEPVREELEIEMLRWSASNNFPTLGICRGFQMMNSYADGRLIPDLPTWQKSSHVEPVIAHRASGDPSSPAHPITLQPRTKLGDLLGVTGDLEVNSSHHQAIATCGKALHVSAKAPDGIIEAVEDPSRDFWIGVQFHPERMWKRFPIFSKLFSVFTERAQQKVP